MFLKLIIKILIFNLIISYSQCFIFTNKIIPSKLILKSHKKFQDRSFHGVWNLKDNNNQTSIINLCPSGKIESPSNLNNSLYGVWFTDDEEINLLFLKNKCMVDKIYTGKTINDSIKITGLINYGSEDPDYSGKFSLEPIFPSLHNISKVTKKQKDIVDASYITGKWILENLVTKSIFIINIYENYTWENSFSNLGGIWNIYDSDNGLDLTSGIRTKGDYIWLWAQRLGTKTKNRLNLQHDIIFNGKIIKVSKTYLSSEESPSNENSEIKNLATKINGSLIHSVEDPEICESFYMKRYWDD